MMDDIHVDILLSSLLIVFVLLAFIRAFAIHLSRRSSRGNDSVAALAALEFISLNTPGEAVKSLRVFGRTLFAMPGSFLGLLAGFYLLLWAILAATVVAGIAIAISSSS